MEIKYLYIKQSVFQTMEREVRKTAKKVETGGIIMGYYTVKDEIVVTHCSGPGPNAKQKKHSIVFDSVHSQDYVNKVYSATGGNSTYIGDWHSHTAPILSPSLTDKRELTNITKRKTSRLPFPLMIICSLKKGDFVFKAFYLVNKNVIEIENVYVIG